MYFLSIICSIIIGIIIGSVWGRNYEKKVLIYYINREKLLANKNLKLFLMMVRWMRNKNQGKYVASTLSNMGYKTVAIYGVSYIGELLVEELNQSDIEVMFCIDRKVKGMIQNKKIYNLDTKIPKVDAIIVTPITMIDEIEMTLKEYTDSEILSIEEILFTDV